MLNILCRDCPGLLALMTTEAKFHVCSSAGVRASRDCRIMETSLRP